VRWGTFRASTRVYRRIVKNKHEGVSQIIQDYQFSACSNTYVEEAVAVPMARRGVSKVCR
jgi:hypothetical protein